MLQSDFERVPGSGLREIVGGDPAAQARETPTSSGDGLTMSNPYHLISSGNTFDHLLSEARKFGVSVVTANQYLAQYPTPVRAALFSAGTNLFFRCSPEDAPSVARTLGGGSTVERLIGELPNRHFLIRSGSSPRVEVVASGVVHNTISSVGLVARSTSVWARPRTETEKSIALRRGRSPRREALAEWD